MFNIDQNILRTKLKSMTRMVHDHPELQGNIGTLIPFSEAFLKQFKTDPEKQEQTDNSPKKKKDKPEKPKTLRKRKKRQLTHAELEARKQGQADQQGLQVGPHVGQQAEDGVALVVDLGGGLAALRPAEEAVFFLLIPAHSCSPPSSRSCFSSCCERLWMQVRSVLTNTVTWIGFSI